jgi:hypothetical protein
MIVQAILLTIGEFILFTLCMTFGGAPNPSKWSNDVSELTTDLANDLVHDNGWDHTQQASVTTPTYVE